MTLDRVWDDMRLPSVGYANDFDWDGFGSIDFGGGIDRVWGDDRSILMGVVWVRSIWCGGIDRINSI